MNITTIDRLTAELQTAIADGDRDLIAAAVEDFTKAAVDLADRRHEIFEVTTSRPIGVPGVGILSAFYAEHVGDEDYRLADGTPIPFDVIATTARVGYPNLPEGARLAFDI